MGDNLLRLVIVFSNLQIFYSFRATKFEIKMQFRENTDEKLAMLFNFAFTVFLKIENKPFCIFEFSHKKLIKQTRYGLFMV